MESPDETGVRALLSDAVIQHLQDHGDVSLEGNGNGDFVVMPNHVHLLAAFPDDATLKKQCFSWLHYTARQINQRCGNKGKFWQQEPFDHLVRNSDEYKPRSPRDPPTNASC